MFSVIVANNSQEYMIGNLTKYDRVNRLNLREVFLMFSCLHWRAAHISLDAINFFIPVPAFVYQTKREGAHRSNVRYK